MDQAAIAKFTEHYRRLPPDDLTGSGITKSSEEAIALDAGEGRRDARADRASNCKMHNRRNFRIDFIAFLLGATAIKRE